MEIRLHVLHGMHFIMYHDDRPLRKRHSSFSSAHKNTKTISQRLKKCPLTVKSVFEKMRLQMTRPLKKTGGETLSPRSFLRGGVRLYRWPMFSVDTMWKVGQIGEKTSLYKQKRIREERAEYMRLYCLLWTTPTPTAQLFLFCRLFHS